jgi:hypothetical protein
MASNSPERYISLKKGITLIDKLEESDISFKSKRKKKLDLSSLGIKA